MTPKLTRSPIFSRIFSSKFRRGVEISIRNLFLKLGDYFDILFYGYIFNIYCSKSKRGKNTLDPLVWYPVLWRRSNSSSATTLRWNFSQTFLRFKSTTVSLVCENPLRVEHWCILNVFEVNTKPPISLATIVWQYFFNTCPKDLWVICPEAADEA